MSDYNYPYKDAAFILENLVDFDALATASGLEEVNTELAMAVLEEANRFAVEVVAPLNVVGDRQGVLEMRRRLAVAAIGKSLARLIGVGQFVGQPVGVPNGQLPPLIRRS